MEGLDLDTRVVAHHIADHARAGDQGKHRPLVDVHGQRHHDLIEQAERALIELTLEHTNWTFKDEFGLGVRTPNFQDSMR